MEILHKNSFVGKIKCPICNDYQIKELFKVKEVFNVDNQIFSINKCLNCAVVFTFPSLNWQEMKKYYKKDVVWKKEYNPNNYFIKLIKRVEEIYLNFYLKYETELLLRTVNNRGKLLDVGCGNGKRLLVFEEGGFQCFGIEPSDDYIKNEIPIEKTTLEKFNCAENSFDVITLYHVFEHFRDPIRNLRIIRKILKPGGALVIQVPNLNSLQARFFKKRWLFLGIPVHYFHYTSKTIGNLLIQNGFRVKKIDYKPNFVHPSFWSLSLFPKLNPQIMWKKEEREETAILKRAIYFLLIPFSIFLAWFEALFKKGGHMTIYAINQRGYNFENENFNNQSSK